MGTKGSKNTPITARISTGLFNQKKGVTEPLLDVGPAGVRGNNQTKDIPSPSKMKGYSMKASPFKQKADNDSPYSDENVIQSRNTTKSAGSQIVSKGKEIKEDVYDTGKSLKGLNKEQLDWRDNEIERLGGIDNYHTEYGSKTKGKKTGSQVGTGKFEDDKVTNIPGETKTTLGDLEVKGQRGMVAGWEVNQQARKQKRLSDDISDSEKNMGKYTGRLAKHTDPLTGKAKKGHERRFRNATANLSESTRNNKNSTSQLDTYSRGVAQGASGHGGDTFSVKTKATLSDLGDLEKQNQYNTDGTIGGPKVKSNTNPAEDTKKKTDVKTNAKMSNKLFKKKSPLKMKYFK
jgi:hypothetical protein